MQRVARLAAHFSGGLQEVRWAATARHGVNHALVGVQGAPDTRESRWGCSAKSGGRRQRPMCLPIRPLLQPEEGLHAQNTSAPGDGYNVAVLGAAGGIGQPLSLLLKL